MSTATADLTRELERTRADTLRWFALDAAELARTYAPGKWSVAYILHHLADSETVFFDRIRRVLSGTRPVLWVMDQDAWAAEYTRRPLEVSRRLFDAVRQAIIYDAQAHYEPDGDREWVHSVDGVRTLRMEFDKVAAHNEHHLRQIRQALGRTAG